MTRKILSHPDWIIAVVISLAAIWLHLTFLTHAGGLWRDEVAVANISRLPTLGQTWQALPHDHCPIMFPDRRVCGDLRRNGRVLSWTGCEAGHHAHQSAPHCRYHYGSLA